MATPDEIALTYQRGQKGTILAALAAVLGLWKRLDADNLTQSWNAGIGRSLVDTVTQAQFVAAAAAPTYLEELAAAQGVLADMSGLVPSALSGIASDGRPLVSLMYQPIIFFKRLLLAGKRPEEAMQQATNFMALVTATQVADAGRGAVNVGITATRAWVTYVRVVNLPACSRCIILAGRAYSWSTGFERHENCDCSMMPRSPDDDPPATPEDLFAQMTPEEQDRRFGKAGAEALRLGGDMGQIVNARRGMKTAGGRLVTTEGTTRRGVAGRRMGSDSRRKSAIRPMPEQLLADAGGDRDLAIQLLERNGFLDASSMRRNAAVQERVAAETEQAAQARAREAAEENARREAAAEQARIESVRLESVRLEAERLEVERLVKAAEQARQEAEQAAAEQAAGNQLTHEQYQSLSDEELAERFNQAIEQGDEPEIERAATEMARRDDANQAQAEPEPEQSGGFARFQDVEISAEDRRVDALVSSGWDYVDAYAEVYGVDAEKLRAEERRARLGADRHDGETLNQTAARLYRDWVHIQWLQAEGDTRGVLLNKAGESADIDPISLFSGPTSRAKKYASEELRRWWNDHQRMTLTEFRAQLLGREGDKSAARTTAEMGGTGI